MNIVFVGDLGPGRTGTQRCAAARRLGHNVIEVNSADHVATGAFHRAKEVVRKIALRLDHYADVHGFTRQVLDAARTIDADILWLDKALFLTTHGFRAFKAAKPGRKIVFYTPDDFKSRFNWSRHYNAHTRDIDLIVTTKSYNVEEYRSLGFRNVVFTHKVYDPVEHVPVDHDPDSLRTEFEFGVGFIGGYERERADLIREIARRGIPVHVTGSFWDRGGAFPANVTFQHGDIVRADYARRILRTKINLAFLRKQARDLQTARSIEIPACAGFMLTERTTELTAMFEPGVQAEFFDTADELYEKCRYYLDNDAARETIAREGHRRIKSGPFRTDDMVRSVLDMLTQGIGRTP